MNPRHAPPIYDLLAEAALAAEVASAAEGAGNLSEVQGRRAIVGALKDARARVLAEAERLLLAERRGFRCAERLSRAQDAIIRVLYDLAIKTVLPVDNPSSAERMAVVAVGGYGRGTLAPGSDIDLLFVLPYKQTPWGESVVEFILYVLWDLGLKVGHATRKIDDCIRLSRSDATIRTSILEARFITGDEKLYDDLVSRFFSEVVAGNSASFIQAKLAERDERHRRHGESRYLVEPNVKESKGGLRDLHTLFWIAKDFYQVMEADELVSHGVFSQEEYERFRKSEDFLWAVRCHLHFLNRRGDDRLTFEVQSDIARRLGYQRHPGLSGVERFMKHYFLVAKDVGDLTAILCAGLELREAKSVPTIGRMLGRMRRRKPQLVAGTDFVIDHERLCVADEEVFHRDPVNLIRIFHVAEASGLDFHPDALKLITRSLRLVDARLRENPEANRLFLELLTSKRGSEAILRRMNETGVLGRFIPDFGKVVAMMQFNMYHHYTVDEHTLRAVGILGQIERGEGAKDHPLANEIIHRIQHRRVLYLALFVHDIAKGRTEDHSVAGGRIARRLARRLGFRESEADLAGWLVEQHLTMSMVAQSRDITDVKTIRDFAGIVQTLERMRLLLLLTIADIKAVGPGVWNGWKGQLLRALYYETEPYLTGGHTEISRVERVKAAKKELAAALSDWSEAERARYLERHYDAYWMRVDLEHRISHARLIAAADASGAGLATGFVTRAFEGVTEITVVAPDHPRLLSTVAGACTIAGANIVDAQIFTTNDGLAVDTIFVTRAYDEEEDEQRRAGRLSALIERVVTGQERLPEVLSVKIPGQRRPSKAFRLPAEVVVDNTLSDRLTVVEASGLDRPGLLHDLTHELSDLNLNIASAHIATFGERAVDVFYVTDLTGQKVTNGARQSAIRRHLTEVFGADGEKAKKGAA